MNITYSLGPSSETEVIFYPDWNYSKGDDMSKSTWRTRNGRLFSYKWYTYNKIKFDTSWIINSDAAIVNSWWSSQTKLLFFKNTDGTVDVTSCMLTAKESPFQSHPEPYPEYFKGAIELEEY